MAISFLEAIRISTETSIIKVGMKYLTDDQVAVILSNNWKLIIEKVEAALINKSGKMVPKVYLNAGTEGDFRAMPSALENYGSIKWIGVFPNNRKHNLPTTLGTFILNDLSTGQPLIAMDCTTLTAYRTAATSAIAAKYCSPNARSFSFIGCGKQSKYHIEAYEAKYGAGNIDNIKVFDTDADQKTGLYGWACDKGVSKNCQWTTSVKEAVTHTDVVTTITPSRQPYLDFNFLNERCHVNAIGADAVGKRELMTNVIEKAKNVICDDFEQASHSGELQYNEWPKLKVYNLSDVIKHHEEMKLDEGLSVFDSTGVAIEDIAMGILIYQLQQ